MSTSATMSTRVTLAAAIVVGSAISAAAQTPYYYYHDREPIGRGALSSLAAPPSPSESPAATGGGSVGYNETLRRNDW
jgi:hypothetical protein